MDIFQTANHQTAINLFINKRNKISNLYNLKLKNLDLILPKVDNKIVNAFHLYTVRLKNNEYSINAPAFLKVGDDGLLKVQTEFALDQVGLDFDGALERLSAGTQKSKLSAADQKQLYQDFNDVPGLTSSSFRLSASNVEDAFAELMARQVRVGYDAGFYG